MILSAGGLICSTDEEHQKSLIDRVARLKNEAR